MLGSLWIYRIKLYLVSGLEIAEVSRPLAQRRSKSDIGRRLGCRSVTGVCLRGTRTVTRLAVLEIPFCGEILGVAPGRTTGRSTTRQRDKATP